MILASLPRTSAGNSFLVNTNEARTLTAIVESYPCTEWRGSGSKTPALLMSTSSEGTSESVSDDIRCQSFNTLTASFANAELDERAWASVIGIVRNVVLCMAAH